MPMLGHGRQKLVAVICYYSAVVSTQIWLLRLALQLGSLCSIISSIEFAQCSRRCWPLRRVESVARGGQKVVIE